MFTELTPMDYVRNHVTVSNARKSLYNCVFNKHKIEYEEIEGVEPNTDRKLAGAVSIKKNITYELIVL